MLITTTNQAEALLAELFPGAGYEIEDARRVIRTLSGNRGPWRAWTCRVFDGDALNVTGHGATLDEAVREMLRIHRNREFRRARLASRRARELAPVGAC